LADLLIRLVKLFAGVHLSEILLGRVNGLLIILYYALILFIAFVYIRRPLLKKAMCLIWLAVVIFPLAAVKLHRNQSPDLVLSCLDVGHGQAVLAQLPGGKNLLFDAGSLFQSNPARRIIIPYLRFEAIDNLDAIIISHNDIDHINAIPELVTDLKIAGVYANDDFFIDTENSGAPEFLDCLLKTSGFDIRTFDNLKIKSPADVKIIWPL
jgi:competence protein ComEC